MYQLHTAKQHKYFKKVVKLHYEKGYGEYEISRILPISPNSVLRWIRIFASENGNTPVTMKVQDAQPASPTLTASEECKALKKRVKELEALLLKSEIKAEAYDEMINVAETMFNIPIRKKAGAKQ